MTWTAVKSLRFRITAVATVAIAFFLGLTAFFSVRYADNRLIDQVDRSLVNQAVFVRQQLQEHHILSATGPAGEFGQFFRADGTFIGSGTNIVGFPPLIHVTATGPNPRLFTVSNPRLGRLRILEEQFGSGSAPILVLGQQINQIAAARRVLTLLPTIGVPVVVLALAVIVWIVVGRAMSPVEAIRRAVAEVSDADPSERLPSPGTGDELERLVETMNVMLDRLHRAVERERTFIADASHELRSPLAGVRATLEGEHTSLDEFRQSQRTALSALQRLQDLADQLLILHASGTAAQPRRLIDIDELVLSQVDLLQRTTDLSIDASAVSGGQVVADETDMTRVIENLSSNALRHAVHKIVFAVSEADDWVELSVTDDGPGVPENKRQTVFERFSRLDSSRSRSDGGVGLGLAIVREIVGKYGGTVRVEDGPGRGARFIVTLPASTRLVAT